MLIAIFLLFNFALILLKGSTTTNIISESESINDESTIEPKRKLDQILMPTTEREYKRKLEAQSSLDTQNESSDEDLVLPKYYLKMKTACDGMKSKTVIEYPDAPETNFFDKLMRRSVDFPLQNGPNLLSLWEMPCTLGLNAEFHTEAFFFIVSERINFSEECLMEYFLFLYDQWIDESTQVSDEAVEAFILNTCRHSIALNFLELFSLAFNQIEDENNGLNLLLLLKELSTDSSIDSQTEKKLKLMSTIIVKIFPSLAYNDKLRLIDFDGSDLVSDLGVFLHFLPIFGTLIIEDIDVFQAEIEIYDLFILFNLGNLENALPMGVGGLKVISEMFLISKFNLSVFDTSEKGHLKVLIAKRLFDALFLGLNTVEVIKLLYDKNAFSILEAYLKYTPNLRSNVEVLEIFNHVLIENQEYYYNQIYFIIIFLSYRGISEDALAAIRDNPNTNLVQFLIAMSEYVASIDSEIDIKNSEKMKFPISESEKLKELSETLEYPCQLEVARLFLARACKIPVEMTGLDYHNEESSDWSEVIGFVNFYIERSIAKETKISSGHLIFEL